jgi:hypothetical protein
VCIVQEAQKLYGSVRSPSTKGDAPEHNQLLASLAAKADTAALEALQCELQAAKADATRGLDTLRKELGLKPGADDLEGLRRQLADKADRSELEVLVGFQMQVRELWSNVQLYP